jgi:drug/metabolite transporter (DMT)-like permease
VIFGLGAAFGWGVADLFAAMSGRRIGSWATVLIAQVASALLVGLVLLMVGPELAGLAPVAGWLVPSAVLAAVAYVSLYHALELGPIAVVSPVLASYAVIPVLLAVAVLGETLTGLQVVGVAVTIGGAVLTSTDLRALRAGTHSLPPGLPWAAASTLMFGVATFVFGWAAQRAGWLPVMWLSRSTGAVCFLLVAGVIRARGGRSLGAALPASALGLTVLLGFVDLTGTMSYARGAEVGLISIVTAVSATYPIIPVFGGIAVFGERPAPSQFVGVALVVAGLILLGGH